MFKIDAETFSINGAQSIMDIEKMLWLINKDIGEKLGVQTICDLVDKEIIGKRKTNNPTKEEIKKC